MAAIFRALVTTVIQRLFDLFQHPAYNQTFYTVQILHSVCWLVIFILSLIHFTYSNKWINTMYNSEVVVLQFTVFLPTCCIKNNFFYDNCLLQLFLQHLKYNVELVKCHFYVYWVNNNDIFIFEFNYFSTFCQPVISQAPQAIYEWDFFMVYVNVVCFRKSRINFFPNFVRVLLLYSSTNSPRHKTGIYCSIHKDKS